MLKKNKQLIMGFLLGALIFGAVPVGAKVQDYLLKKSETKLMVDGGEFANKELPVLNYQGYNYIPAATFREICDILGLGFEYVADKNEIQISTEKESIKMNEVQRPSVQADTITITDDENIILINGVKYISKEGVNEYLISINQSKQHRNERYYMSPFKDYTNKLYTLDGGKETIIIDNVPMKRIYGEQFYNKSAEFIEYDFFENTIIPLIK